MPLDPTLKRAWIDVQRQYPVPVNAIGVPIDPRDRITLRVWSDEGIDRYVSPLPPGGVSPGLPAQL